MEDQIQNIVSECREDFRQAAETIKFDPAKFAHHLAEYDMTEAEQLMLMRVVWDFMMMMCDAGFKIDAVSLASDEVKTEASNEAPLEHTTYQEERSP